MSIFANSKAVGAIVTLAPPAIEDAEIQEAMSTGFHAAGAGGLEWATRRVEPNVAAGDHLASDVHIVILDENQVALQVAVFAEMNDVLDVALPIVIPRVGLAGEHELNGPRLVARQTHDVVEL